jgi:hypothetical protein
VADVEQVFDLGTDPSSKARLLAGASNIARCPHCGFQGNIGTPIIYHDPQKELLLTFVPPELGLPVQEQERTIGPLINQIVNNLPQEKRKGYLLRPQAMLTMQTMIERILEADGITKEMIQAQQQRMSLISRLLEASSEDVRLEIVKQDEKLIDADFFTLLRRVAAMSLSNGDQETAHRLSDVQKVVMENTTFGQELLEQTREVETALQSLKAHGDQLTREKLLELVIQAPTDTRVNALVSFARPVMDYTFFGLLTERIERSTGAEHEQLLKLREHLLDMTREIDQQLAERAQRSRALLNAILNEKNVTQATEQALQAVDEFFIQALGDELDATRKKGDLERIAKLGEIEEVLKKASTPPPEVAFIEDLMDSADEETIKTKLEAHRQEITPQFIETLTALAGQISSEDNPELFQRFQKVYQLAVRMTMEASLKGN